MERTATHTEGEWQLQAPKNYANRRRVTVSNEITAHHVILAIEDYTDNSEEALANAQLIVTAVNNHDKLKEALKNNHDFLLAIYTSLDDRNFNKGLAQGSMRQQMAYILDTLHSLEPSLNTDK